MAMIDLRCEEPRQCPTGDSPLLAESSIGLFRHVVYSRLDGHGCIYDLDEFRLRSQNISGVATRDGDRHEPPWSSQLFEERNEALVDCRQVWRASPRTYTRGEERYHGEPTTEQPRQRTQAAMWVPRVQRRPPTW